MAQTLDPKKAINYAPNGLKETIKAITEGHDFKTFLAADNWNKQKSATWIISCSLDDVNAMSTILGIPRKSLGTKKIVDYVTTDKWKLRFRESQKTGAGRAPDAATTAKQEKGSAYIFEEALKRSSPWPTEQALVNDAKVMTGLREIYPEVDDDWISNYWKQHKVILKEFGNSGAHKFDHSGNGSFMDFITDVVRQNFGIAKKDNWNPADIWMIKGDKKKLIKQIEETVYGSKDSQSIQQLNALMRGLYKSRKLVGISLKKISGKEAKWEEYNIDKLTLDEIDEYKYSNIDIEINLGKNMTQDTKVQLRKSSGGGYNFQIKANTSTEFSNLKWESTPVGATAARGGKAQVDYVVTLLKDNGQDFDKTNSNYPRDLSEFTAELTKYKQMFDKVSRQVETKCSNSNEFAVNIENLFLSNQAHIANTKLMQLTFVDKVLNIKSNNKKYTEFWTDMVFLSIKKGDRFGPFGKLY
jgi:hypothetical protein